MMETLSTLLCKTEVRVATKPTRETRTLNHLKVFETGYDLPFDAAQGVGLLSIRNLQWTIDAKRLT
jgi:hypothetical protein